MTNYERGFYKPWTKKEVEIVKNYAYECDSNNRPINIVMLQSNLPGERTHASIRSKVREICHINGLSYCTATSAENYMYTSSKISMDLEQDSAMLNSSNISSIRDMIEKIFSKFNKGELK